MIPPAVPQGAQERILREAYVARLEAVVELAPRPPSFNTNTPEYVAALAALDAEDTP